MLARAPGDVTRANPAQLKRSPSPRRSPHPAWGNGAVFPATPAANARRTSERARTSPRSRLWPAPAEAVRPGRSARPAQGGRCAEDAARGVARRAPLRWTVDALLLAV